MVSGILLSISFVPMMYTEVSEVSNSRLIHIACLQPIRSIAI